MKPLEFKLNPALSDQLNIMRMQRYIGTYLRPGYRMGNRFRRRLMALGRLKK